MRGYEVRVHRGRASPELHRIVAASDEAASERAEQLLVETPDAIGIEVLSPGHQLHVRGVVPAETAPLGPSRLWDLMQRIERARHRAELSEARAAKGSAAYRAEMTEVAKEWRNLARYIEAEGAASNVGLAPAGDAETPAAILSTAPSGRVSELRGWLGVAAGMVIGALGALSLAAPRWIETSTGVDLDRGSGVLEWGLAGIAPIAAIAVLAMRASPRMLAKIGRRRS